MQLCLWDSHNSHSVYSSHGKSAALKFCAKQPFALIFSCAFTYLAKNKLPGGLHAFWRLPEGDRRSRGVQETLPSTISKGIAYNPHWRSNPLHLHLHFSAHKSEPPVSATSLLEIFTGFKIRNSAHRCQVTAASSCEMAAPRTRSAAVTGTRNRPLKHLLCKQGELSMTNQISLLSCIRMSTAVYRSNHNSWTCQRNV